MNQASKQIELIRDRLLTAQSRQKKLCKKEKEKRPLEFNVGDHVFLKMTLAVGRSMKENKLNPRYLGPFQILEKYGTTAYKIALPPSLANIHDVFHVSQLKKYLLYPLHVLEYENMYFQGNMTYELKLNRIIDT